MDDLWKTILRVMDSHKIMRESVIYIKYGQYSKRREVSRTDREETDVDGRLLMEVMLRT